MIGREIRSILLNDSDVTALVGSRVYSDLGSQTVRTSPYIVYRINDRIREHSQDPAAVDLYRIEFFIHGDTYAEVQEIEKRLDGALDRYPIGTVVNSYIMDGIHQEDSQDDPYDADEDGSRTKITEYNFRIKVYDLGMIYSLSETDTNQLWINGARVYERVFNLGSSTGTVDTGLDKDYSILDYSLIEVRASGQVVNANAPDPGTTNWEIDVNALTTQSYVWLRYIKETVS